MVTIFKPGYDSAKKLREEDVLGRWRFAAEIAEVVRTTPKDWSVRVGVFARWGAGKTTVLQFIESILNENNYLVFWFNPWADLTFESLMSRFGKCLIDAASKIDIPVESKVKTRARWVSRFKGVTRAARLLSEGLGKDKAFTTGASLVEDWLKVTANQIESIRKHLGDKRVLVFIDDLDRCVPELLPKLLMSLKEILDLPGFTFILAFDDEIVSKALSEINPAWGGGMMFLEKILDFTFHLPPITCQDKVILLQKSLRAYCDFVPVESINEIQDLIPNNPRRLKALVRGLRILGPQLARHDLDDLNWTDIWIGQLVRQESQKLYEKLLEGQNLSEFIGAGSKVTRGISKKSDKSSERDEYLEIEETLREYGIEDELQLERLKEIVVAARSRSSLEPKYSWQLTYAPPAVTEKEFKELLEAWGASLEQTTISDWIDIQTTSRSEKPSNVQDDVFKLLMSYRAGYTQRALEAQTSEEADPAREKAIALLKMTEQFLTTPWMLSESRLKNLYGSIVNWIAIRKSSEDRSLRHAEQAMLLSCLRLCSSQEALGLIELFIPASFNNNFGLQQDVVALKEILRKECVKVLNAKIFKDLISFIEGPNCIKRLGELNRFKAYKYMLFHDESLPWCIELEQKFAALIQRAKHDAAWSDNLMELLSLLANSKEYPRADISAIGVKKILADHKFVSGIWEIVSSRKMQWQAESRLLFLRAELIESGIPETILPLNDSLETRAHEMQSES